MESVGGMGIHGCILNIMKAMYAHDSAAVRHAIFRCLLGVKQGYPLSPTLFGLYFDGLERHLLDTAGIDAPSLLDNLVSRLLYADDLILKSTIAVWPTEAVECFVMLLRAMSRPYRDEGGRL